MPGKSFEEQVREQLTELPMKPGPSVWLGIAAGLQKERKRRWLIWLVFLLAGLGTATLWVLTDSDSNSVLPPSAKQTQTGKHQMESDKVTDNNNKIIPSKPMPGSVIPMVKETNEQTKKIVNSKIKESTVNHFLKRKDKQPEVVQVNTNNAKGLLETPPKKEIGEQALFETQKEMVQEGIMNTKGTSDATAFDTAAPLSYPESKHQEAFIKNDSIIEKLDKAVNASTTRDKAKKWILQAGLDGGISGLVTYETPVYLSRYGAGTGTVSTGFSNQNPKIQYNQSYTIGVQFSALKSINPKNAAGFYLGYSLLQNRVKVGMKVDSTVYFNSAGTYNLNGYYYTNKDSTEYQNRFHFLTAGIRFQKQFGLIRKLSVNWDVSAGISVLLASNGLHYDTTQKKFFNNNSLYHKVQPNLSTGFDLIFGSKKKWFLGPHFTYFTNRMSRVEGVNQHFFQSTIRLTVAINGKK